MKFLQKINRKVSYLGYILVGAAINTILVRLLPYYNPAIPLWPAYLILFAGIGIMWGTLCKFSDVERLKILLADLIYIAIFVIFGVIDLPRGLNFVIGSIIAVTFFYYFIYKQYLFYLE